MVQGHDRGQWYRVMTGQWYKVMTGDSGTGSWCGLW